MTFDGQYFPSKSEKKFFLSFSYIKCQHYITFTYILCELHCCALFGPGAKQFTEFPKFTEFPYARRFTYALSKICEIYEMYEIYEIYVRA